MKRLLLLLCLINFSLMAQSTDNTAKELQDARARAAVEEQKLLDKEAKQKAKDEAKAQKAAEKEAAKTANTANQNDSRYSFFGRNAIGFNFAPTIQIPTLKFGVNKLGNMGGVELKGDKSGFGMGFSYEHKLAKWVTLSGDFNFGNGNFVGKYNNLDDLIDADNSGNVDREELAKKAKVDVKFDTKAWAVGFRFYTKKNAPFGFFLYPKVGGTIVKLSGSYPEYKDGSFDAITDADLVKAKPFDTTTHGIYAALELGWRIQLFPKLMANSPVQVALDISLLDVGYYFKPWTTGVLDTIGSVSSDFNGLSSYEKYMNIRFVPLPRLGITVKF